MVMEAREEEGEEVEVLEEEEEEEEEEEVRISLVKLLFNYYRKLINGKTVYTCSRS